MNLQRRWRGLIYWLAGMVVVLVCLRLALPVVLKNYVNRQLNRSQDYGGSVGHITVALWRGAYEINQVNIFQRTGKVHVPFFSASVLDLSLQWSELFHGKIVSKIIMVAPQLNFVSGPTKQQSQTGTGNNWADTLESLAPFKINSLIITNGQVHFHNPYSDPPVDIYMTSLFGVATNLTNAREIKQALPAGIYAYGNTLGNGSFNLQCNINPLASTPTFQLNLSLTNIDLTRLNSFLLTYGKFEVARGDFDFFTSFAAADEKYDGYVKVLFKNLKFLQWQKEKKEDALQVFWEAIVGSVTTILKNHPHDQLATKIPITGAFNNTDVHLWPTIQTLLRNAFIRALVPKYDEQVNIQNAKSVETNAPSPLPMPSTLTGHPDKSATIQLSGTNELAK
jgi:hypothetical protein